MKTLLSSVAVAAILAGTPALAAGDMKTTKTMQTASSVEFVNNQSDKDWLSSNLVGATVKNHKDETLGDINNVIVDEQGKVKGVVIGVGGFLGIGEKDVGVRFSSLNIVHDEMMTDTDDTKATEKMTTTEKVRKRDLEKDTATDQPGKDKDADNKRTASESAEDRHDDFVIVLNTTKEQLENAPEFKYLGEKREKRTDASGKMYDQKKRQ